LKRKINDIIAGRVAVGQTVEIAPGVCIRVLQQLPELVIEARAGHVVKQYTLPVSVRETHLKKILFQDR